MKQRGLASLTVLLLAFGVSLLSSKVSACRDCPFPLRIEPGHWLMPAQVVEIRMTEERMKKGYLRSRLEVLSRYGTVLAIGYKQWKPPAEELEFRVYEVAGAGVWNAYISFPNQSDRSQLKVRFRCLTQGQCILRDQDFN